MPKYVIDTDDILQRKALEEAGIQVDELEGHLDAAANKLLAYWEMGADLEEDPT